MRSVLRLTQRPNGPFIYAQSFTHGADVLLVDIPEYLWYDACTAVARYVTGGADVQSISARCTAVKIRVSYGLGLYALVSTYIHKILRKACHTNDSRISSRRDLLASRGLSDDLWNWLYRRFGYNYLGFWYCFVPLGVGIDEKNTSLGITKRTPWSLY